MIYPEMNLVTEKRKGTGFNSPAPLHFV